MTANKPPENGPDPVRDAEVEQDSRFPSGKWVGFFLQKWNPGRHQMELILRFANGVVTGEGRDAVGEFLIRGRYQVDDGKCHWHKRYIGKHDVFYKGYGEGKGVWGTWEIGAPLVHDTGGFRIWPEGMADPTVERLREAVDVPASIDHTDSPFSEERLNEAAPEDEPAGV
jgi:hypothetical protein